MIDLTIYLATIGILSAIIMAFVIHNLKTNKREYESQKRITELQKETNELKEYKIQYLQLQNEIHQKESQQKRQKEIQKKDSQQLPPNKPSGGWVRNW
jgi:FtsZ-interacting cell division protein ZipA